MIKFLDLSSEINDIRQEIDSAIKKIVDQSNFILGKELHQFEKNFANYINTKYCLGVGNGTDALEIAITSLNLKPDDEIITQANTFISTCSSIINSGLQLNLVDIDSNTYQMNLNHLEKQINSKTKAVIIVHLTGSCVNMNQLMQIINRYNLILIEDCAQSHGASYQGKNLGTFGTLATFSFYPGKNLGAFGDGGAICTNNDQLYQKILRMRNLGSIKKYYHEILGRNSRLDTLQASILDIKLKYLDLNNHKRRQKANLYNQYLKKLDQVQIPKINDGCNAVYHLYIIRCKKRDQLKEYLEEKGIETGIHYLFMIPDLECFSKSKCFSKSECFSEFKYWKSYQNSKKILSLPIYPNLSNQDIKYICNQIENFYLET